MKKIFKYFGLLLSVVLMGAVTSCDPNSGLDEADLGLGVKVFFPTKVVAGQPMTINGTGFNSVTEIVFPNGVTVKDFDVVSDEMIRVVAPDGINANGGNLIVRTDDDEVETAVALTVGNTVVTGFSPDAGETINGGELITIYGKDLEFICGVEFIDDKGNPKMMEDKVFYRKGTDNVIVIVPRNVYEGTFKAKIYTIDGKEFEMDEYNYVPAREGGHMEIVKKVLWTNELGAPISWGGDYRFGLEGNDGGNECIATFPADVWETLKTSTFYLTFTGEDPQIRVTTGWWSTTWTGNDIVAGDEKITKNSDGSYTLAINLEGDPILDAIDVQHLLFTGDRYTPVDLYIEEQEWVDGAGTVIMEVPIWTNETENAISWSSDYRFGLEGNDGGNECIATFPADVWNRLKTETFYLKFKSEDPQIRVTTGWWSTTWTGNDFFAGDEKITDNGDGTFSLEINLTGDPILDVIDVQHLLFTGDRYTPVSIYFLEEVEAEDGADGISKNVFWENNDTLGAISWSGDYRFGLDGKDGGNECAATFSEDIWNVIKTGTFYMVFSGDEAQIRVTTGWWSTTWATDDIFIGDERITDNGNGTYTLKINFEGDPIVDALDDQHLLFTGDKYTVLSLYY